VGHIRVGFLYGHFTDENRVQAHFIYEPPQDSDNISFHIMETEEDRVSLTLSALL
jgi:hypothetical protein